MLQFYMIKNDKEAYLIQRLSSVYIGDDAAVVEGLIYSTDAFFENIHFRREWMSLAQIARKSLIINFSDAVAMNATPLYILITLSIPKDLTYTEIDELIGSFESTADEFDCKIIGGDTVGGENLNISITVISKSDDPLYRNGLKEGDLLAYTGTIGESARDLKALLAGDKIPYDSRFFEPDLRSGFVSKSRKYLSAGMDISDGLFCDTNKLLDINKYGLIILKNIDDKMGLSGEEYEMLVGFNEDQLEHVKAIADSLDLPLNVFAKVGNNRERFPCKSHHFDT